MSYSPAPIDTSQVQLDAELEKLLELIAKNTHEVWARQRIGDGWRYGPKRDDALKEHPGLVAYEELSETEKDYDRVVAQQVLKTILALGFRIEKSGEAGQGLLNAIALMSNGRPTPPP